MTKLKVNSYKQQTIQTDNYINETIEFDLGDKHYKGKYINGIMPAMNYTDLILTYIHTQDNSLHSHQLNTNFVQAPKKSNICAEQDTSEYDFLAESINKLIDTVTF